MKGERFRVLGRHGGAPWVGFVGPAYHEATAAVNALSNLGKFAALWRGLREISGILISVRENLISAHRWRTAIADGDFPKSFGGMVASIKGRGPRRRVIVHGADRQRDGFVTLAVGCQSGVGRGRG
jgi:hypothetical protein